MTRSTLNYTFNRNARQCQTPPRCSDSLKRMLNCHSNEQGLVPQLIS